MSENYFKVSPKGLLKAISKVRNFKAFSWENILKNYLKLKWQFSYSSIFNDLRFIKFLRNYAVMKKAKFVIVSSITLVRSNFKSSFK